MTDENWKPLFRASTSTVSKVLRSQAFLHSREVSADIAEDPVKLRALADSVEKLDHRNQPLAVIADRASAAVRFLRARADDLDTAASACHSDAKAAEALTGPLPNAGVAARERLLVAGLHYLVTPVDLVPDFRPGGYIDDVLLLAWVFGVAVSELAPYLSEAPDHLEAPSADS
jgi:uncharacterized membrane protein YkvA (DUF1232 family)